MDARAPENVLMERSQPDEVDISVDAIDWSTVVVRRREIAAEAEAAAQANLTKAAQLRRMWDAIHEDLTNRRPVAAFLEVQRALKKRADLDPSDVLVLEDALHALRGSVEQIVIDGEREIPAALERSGLTLDPSARHPIYSVERGFITITIDAERLTASISARGGAVRREPMDPEGIAAAALDVHARIFSRKDSHVTMERLRLAYRMILMAEGGRLGETVSLERLRSELSLSVKAIPPDEFNVDLASVVRAANEGGKGRLTLANTRDTKSGFLLYGLEEAGYIGYLSIEGE